MSAVYVVATIRVLPIHRQSESREQPHNAFHYQQRRCFISFWGTIVRFAGQRQYCYIHRNGSVHIQQRHYKKYSSENDKPKKEKHILIFAYTLS